MIDAKDLIKNPNKYKQNSKNKNLNLDYLIDKTTEDYKSYLKLLQDEQQAREILNGVSKMIKSMGIKDQEILKHAQLASNQAKNLTNQINILKESINLNLSKIPNLILDEVPIGKDESENVEIKTFFDEKKIITNKPHWEIMEENNLALFLKAVELSGTRHIIYKDLGAKLIKAIELFMLDNHISNGYTLYDTPVIVNERTLYNTGQLPKMKNDLFKLENGQYLIPTSEVTLTNLVSNKILNKEDLPLKFVAVTSSFRKEAGSAGRDTRGIIRMHQFRKVEIVQIVDQQSGIKALDQMVKDASLILKKLELPFRIVKLVSGDLSFGSSITYDLEVWMPSSNTYREISSISLMGDFQSRRMNARYRDDENNKKLVYTLNGSGLAIDRTFAAILENYLYKDINNIPEVLKKYLI